MQPDLGLPVQDVVIVPETILPSSGTDVPPQSDAPLVADQMSHRQRQQQQVNTTRPHQRQSSGSDVNSGSSRSSSSSSREQITRSSSSREHITRSPPSSSDVLVSEGVTSKGTRSKQSREPGSVTSPSNLRPQSAGFNRRKIFGRSSSIRDMLGAGSSNVNSASTTAKRNSNGLQHVSSNPATSSTPSTKESGLGFLRHMGSKSFLNLSDSKGMSSSDHLPLTSPDPQSSKRLSESLKIFGRRRGRSVSKSLDTPNSSVSEFGQATRNNSEATVSGSARHSGDTSGSVSSSERQQRLSEPETARVSNHSTTVDISAGIPKRLSGWLQNMVGSESTGDNPDGLMLPPVKETVTPGKSTAHFANSKEAEDPQSETLSSTSAILQSPQTSSALLASPKSSVGSRAGALLQTLTSAPAKVVKSSAATSPSSGAGWASGGVGIDRAFRFFLDNDVESKADEGIWLLGVWHGPSPESVVVGSQNPGVDIAQTSSESSRPASALVGEDSDHTESAQQSSQLASSCITANTISSIDSARFSSPATSLSRANSNSTGAAPDWQATFQPDFTSRVWCTYRNHFAPITRDGTISDEAAANAEMISTAAATQSGLTSPSELAANRNWLGRKGTESLYATDQSSSPSTMSPIGLGAALGASYATATSSLGDKMGFSNLWGRATAAAQAAGFSRGLTTDAGWGCMLRTGQSLLANALLDVHLGRSWQKGPPPLRQQQLYDQLSSSKADRATEQEFVTQWRQKRRQHATYVRILSWFLDDASPASPFSVHRMAREGKRLGKEVGEWFGPSTAAGAIKQLVSDFSDAGMGVVLDHDGVFHLNEVRANSVQQAGISSRRKPDGVWQRPVLILIGIRLGLETVNPIYYDSVKATFSFPQSVGIAGGRPSSSYYFMGHQGNSLFYLDPHNVRPAVPLRFPPKTYPSAVPEHLDVAYRYEKDAKDDEEEWWAHAYGDAQTSTFHCERARRMPIKSLDPSMLLGFLVKDEASLLDLCNRIKALPKTIFSFADSAPQWIDDDDFDPSMESFSESSAGGDFDDIQGGHSGVEADADILAEPQTIGRNLAGSASPRAVLSPGNLDASTIAKQRTAEWLGQGQPSPVSGIAFPSLGAQDSRPVRRPSRTDTRLVSSSSTVTARRGNLDHQLREPSAAVGRADASTSAPIVGDGGTVLDDDSFSTMHLSGSEADSGWEEVSEVGTIAPSVSAAAVAHLVLGESPAGHRPSEPGNSNANNAFVDSVLVERPSTSRTATDSSDLMADMVAISLDTPVSEAPQSHANPSDQARVSMELGSVGTHTPIRRDNPANRAGRDTAEGYFELK